MSFKIPIYISLLFFCLSFLLQTDRSFDQDLGRHIKIGEIIFQTHTVPTVNLTSYTYPDFPFINTHWFFELLIYLGSSLMSLDLIVVIKIVIFLISVYLILKIALKSSNLLVFPISFIFLHLLRERTELRPEVLSFLFTSITYLILDRYLQTKTKLIYLLPLIQLIWINTHIYFFVGFLLQGIFLIQLIWERRYPMLKTLVGVIFVSGLISLVNPNGIKNLIYPLTVTRNYGYTIVENQTIFFLENINFHDPNFLFAKISSLIIIFSIILTLIKKRWSPKDILLPLAVLFLAYQNIRSIPYIFLLALPGVINNLPVLKPNRLGKLIIIVTLILILTESLFYLTGEYYSQNNSDKKVEIKADSNINNAMNFFIQNNLPQPIFNNFDIGSFITYRGYPRIRVFVDGRPEAYPAEFFQQTYIPMQQDLTKFTEVDKLYHFKTIIFSHTDQTPWGQSFLRFITKDPDWKIVFIDQFTIILVKKDQLPDLAPINLDQIEPTDFNLTSSRDNLQLALFLANTDHFQSAYKFTKKSLEINPNNAFAFSLLSYLSSKINNSNDLSILKYRPQQFKIWW